MEEVGNPALHVLSRPERASGQRPGRLTGASHGIGDPARRRSFRMGGARDPDRDGNRARDRQSRLYRALVEPDGEDEADAQHRRVGVMAAFVQIVLIDIVFSIDSIITAVGMTSEFPIMVAAVVVAVAAMMVASGPLGGFIHRNPTVLMLAL